jgi:protein involved in polysaccharide export with SLBB domain
MKTNLSNMSAMGVSAVLLVLGAASSRAATETQTKADSPATQFFFVRGQVTIPGRRVYTNGITLNTAMKMAQGVTAQASTKAVLLRNGQEFMTVDWKAIQQGKAKDIELQPNDSVYVPSKKDAPRASR